MRWVMWAPNGPEDTWRKCRWTTSPPGKIWSIMAQAGTGGPKGTASGLDSQCPQNRHKELEGSEENPFKWVSRSQE